MTIDEIKKFVLENRKAIVVGAVAALVIRAVLFR